MPEDEKTGNRRASPIPCGCLFCAAMLVLIVIIALLIHGAMEMRQIPMETVL